LSFLQVVVVPYNTLLHRSTRESCGISLRGAIVVVDEAHNLLDALAHMHSAELSGHQIVHAIAQLNAYRQRYETRFTPVNRLYLDHMIYVSSRLLFMLGEEKDCLRIAFDWKISNPWKKK
jgi:chromosome transmission fidelity protein 1